MSNIHLLGVWIRRFLMEYLIVECNFSENTQKSYRDTLILLLTFVTKTNKTPMDALNVESITPEIIRLFLSYIEDQRGCSVSTRNQRLAAIHALANFIGKRCPEYIVWSSQIRSIPFKKAIKPSLTYLEKSEMDALLEVQDRTTNQGKRDYALLLFLYNTGARVSEVTQLTIGDLNLATTPSVKILGKGKKIRYCPLWALTIKVLTPLIFNREPIESVFINCRKQPLTRFGVHFLIKRSIAKAIQKVPSLQKKEISAHTIRHTTAVHLLRAGVDINTIRAWLGHVSIDTTNIYAQIDLEMKAKALAHCEIMTQKDTKNNWNNDKKLLAFLKSL